MMRPVVPAAGDDAAPAPAAPPSSAPSSGTPHRGGSSHSGEPVNFGHSEPDNNPVLPPHVPTGLRELRELREPQAEGPGVPGEVATPEPAAPEAAMVPAPAPPTMTGRPVRDRRQPDRLNISSWKGKSYTNNTVMTRPLSQSLGNTSFSLGWRRGRGVKDGDTRHQHTEAAAGAIRVGT